MTPDELIVSLEPALEPYNPIKVTEAQAKRFQNGGELSLDRLTLQEKSPMYRVYSPDNTLLGLGFEKDGNIAVKCIF